MRILVLSHPALNAEAGAAQTALCLAAALRERGHDAVAWSPEPLPAGGSRALWRRQRAAIERFVMANAPFDVIDSPAITATPGLAGCCVRLVVRSVQPELRYLFHAARADVLRLPTPRALRHALSALPRAAAIRRGWHLAHRILCLGSLELEWMRRRYPRWIHKLGFYVSAPEPEQRDALLRVRRERVAPARLRRFLWIGRWSAHKGTGRLVRFIRRQLPSLGAQLTIAGCSELDGRQRSQLAAPGVTIVPTFTRQELPQLLGEHDAGLFTSDIEGWGLGLVEMLESGMPVFATLAGATADLRPYFPRSLRSFPPAPDEAPAAVEDLRTNGYLDRFTWERIAADYETYALA
jgi:glycosyltransferase involved in cell wall biosynthesis